MRARGCVGFGKGVGGWTSGQGSDNNLNHTLCLTDTFKTIHVQDYDDVQDRVEVFILNLLKLSYWCLFPTHKCCVGVIRRIQF